MDLLLLLFINLYSVLCYELKNQFMINDKRHAGSPSPLHFRKDMILFNIYRIIEILYRFIKFCFELDLFNLRKVSQSTKKEKYI